MNVADLVPQLIATSRLLADGSEEFRQLDSNVGDGDLGITITMAAAAVEDVIGSVNQATTANELLVMIGKAIRQANPSTFGTLVGSGLVTSAEHGTGREIDATDVLRIGRSFFQSIARRGRSQLGDKTVLDVVGPSLDGYESVLTSGGSPEDALDQAIAAAERAVEESKDWVSRKGRAAWIGERSAGHPDPGSVAYLRFLQAWRDAAKG